MLLQIIQHTPPWVFILFAGLLWHGLAQLRPRQASLTRITLLPIAMLGLAVWGVVSAFGQTPAGAAALLAWALGGTVAGLWVYALQVPADTRFEPVQQRFHLPGSSLPLAVTMGIFCTKYVVGASLAMQPALAQNGLFALAVSSLYGLFSGIFAARAARLWRLTLQAGQTQHSV